jgi:hypothetical protein
MLLDLLVALADGYQAEVLFATVLLAEPKRS